MKTLLKQIDKLTEQIEQGIYTKEQAMFKVRSLKSTVAYKYEIDSDNYNTCLYPLLDAYNAAQSL